MRLIPQILLFFLLVEFCGCTPSTSVDAPAGWVKIDARKFIFFVPPEIKPAPAGQGIDSFVGDYKGDSISLSFDYGPWSNDLAKEERLSNYVARIERIGGKKAKIASYDFSYAGVVPGQTIGVHFPETAEKDMRLTIFATCKSTNDYATARTIFRTIKFK